MSPTHSSVIERVTCRRVRGRLPEAPALWAPGPAIRASIATQINRRSFGTTPAYAPTFANCAPHLVFGLQDSHFWFLFPYQEGRMANSVYRVTEVVGVSSESWEDAARTAVETAATSVRELRVAEVSRQDLTIQDGSVLNFRVRLGISFKYDPRLIKPRARECSLRVPGRAPRRSGSRACALGDR